MSNKAITLIERVPVQGVQSSSLADRMLLRLSAMLLFAGVLLSLAAGLFHPEREPANNHSAVFVEYASSRNWTLVHLGQFVGIAVLIAGLLVLFFALNVHTGIPGWIARFAAMSAGVTLALYGVLQAVDGVALKHAVDAWVSAPDTEKTARFASAEMVRWLEWGIRSYYSFMLGLSLVLFAAVIVWTARIARPIGYLMGLSGIAYMMQGWVIGVEGFSDSNTVPTLLSILAIIVWSIWLLISAWRMQASVDASSR